MSGKQLKQKNRLNIDEVEEGEIEERSQSRPNKIPFSKMPLNYSERLDRSRDEEH